MNQKKSSIISSIFPIFKFKNVHENLDTLFYIVCILYFISTLLLLKEYIENKSGYFYVDFVILVTLTYAVAKYQSRSASWLILVFSFAYLADQINFPFSLSVLLGFALSFILLVLSARLIQTTNYYHEYIKSKIIYKNVIYKTILSIIYSSFFVIIVIWIGKNANKIYIELYPQIIFCIYLSITLSFGEVFAFSKNRPLCHNPTHKRPIIKSKTTNIISHFLQGDFKLNTIYVWYFAFAVILFKAADALITSNLESISNSIYGKDFIRIFYTAAILYFPFIYASIWNSANRYPGKKIWAILAKSSVVIFALIFLASSISPEQFQQKHENESIVKKEIESINDDLPIQINKNISLIRAYKKDKHIVFVYKIHNPEYFVKKIDIIRESCLPSGPIKSLLLSEYEIIYIYIDRNENVKNKIEINKNDCNTQK